MIALFGILGFQTRRVKLPLPRDAGQSAGREHAPADCFPVCVLDGSFDHAAGISAGAVNSSPGKAGRFTA